MPKGLPKSYIKKWGISKLAWRKFRQGALTKGIRTRTRAIKRRIRRTRRRRNPTRKRGGIRRMVRRRRGRRRGGKSMTRTAFKMIRLGCLVGGGLAEASQYGSMQDKLIGGLLGYGGYHWGEKRFDPAVLARVWLPYLGSVVTTYGIPKLANIIRRL